MTAMAFLNQAAFGWPNITADGNSYPAFSSRLNTPLGLTGASTFNDLFATNAKEAELINAAAQSFKGIVASSVYSLVSTPVQKSPKAPVENSPVAPV